MEKQAHSHCCYVTILGLAMHMRNMRFMRIMREYADADADENLIHIIHI